MAYEIDPSSWKMFQDVEEPGQQEPTAAQPQAAMQPPPEQKGLFSDIPLLGGVTGFSRKAMALVGTPKRWLDEGVASAYGLPGMKTEDLLLGLDPTRPGALSFATGAALLGGAKAMHNLGDQQALSKARAAGGVSNIPRALGGLAIDPTMYVGLGPKLGAVLLPALVEGGVQAPYEWIKEFQRTGMTQELAAQLPEAAIAPVFAALALKHQAGQFTQKPATAEAVAGAQAQEAQKLQPPPAKTPQGMEMLTQGGRLPLPMRGVAEPVVGEVAPRAKLALQHMADRAAGVAEQILTQGHPDIPRSPGEVYTPVGARVEFLDALPEGASEGARAFVLPGDPTIYITPEGRAAILQAPDAAGVQKRINEIIAHEVTHWTADKVNRGPGSYEGEYGHSTDAFMDDRLKSTEMLMSAAGLENQLNQHPALAEGARATQEAGYLEGAFQAPTVVGASRGSFPGQDLALVRGLQQEGLVANPREVTAWDIAPPEGGVPEEAVRPVERMTPPPQPKLAGGRSPKRLIEALLGRKQQEQSSALQGLWGDKADRVAKLMAAEQVKAAAPEEKPEPRVSAALRNVEQKVPTPAEQLATRLEKGRSALEAYTKHYSSLERPYHHGIPILDVLDYAHYNLVEQPGNWSLVSAALKQRGLHPYKGLEPMRRQLIEMMHSSTEAHKEGKPGRLTPEQVKEVAWKLKSLQGAAPRLLGVSESQKAVATGEATDRQKDRILQQNIKGIGGLWDQEQKVRALKLNAEGSATALRDALARIRVSPFKSMTEHLAAVERLKPLVRELDQFRGVLPAGEVYELQNSVKGEIAKLDEAIRKAGVTKETQEGSQKMAAPPTEAPAEEPLKQLSPKDFMARMRAQAKAKGPKPSYAGAGRKKQFFRNPPEKLYRSLKETERIEGAEAVARNKRLERTSPEVAEETRQEALRRAARNREQGELGTRGQVTVGQRLPWLKRLVEEARILGKRAVTSYRPQQGWEGEVPETLTPKGAERRAAATAAARIRELPPLRPENAAPPRPFREEQAARERVISRGASTEKVPSSKLFRTEVKNVAQPRPKDAPPSLRVPKKREVLVQGTPQGEGPKLQKIEGRARQLPPAMRRLAEKVFKKNPYEVLSAREAGETQALEQVQLALKNPKLAVTEQNLRWWVRKLGKRGPLADWLVRNWRDVASKTTDPKEQIAQFNSRIEERLGEQRSNLQRAVTHTTPSGQKTTKLVRLPTFLGQRSRTPLGKDLLAKLAKEGKPNPLAQPTAEPWPGVREKTVGERTYTTKGGPVKDVLGSVEDVKKAAEELLGKSIPEGRLYEALKAGGLKPAAGSKYSSLEALSSYLEHIKNRAEGRIEYWKNRKGLPSGEAGKNIARLRKLIAAAERADVYKNKVLGTGEKLEISKPTWRVVPGKSLESSLRLAGRMTPTGKRTRAPFDESLADEASVQEGLSRADRAEREALKADISTEEQPEGAPLGGGFEVKAPKGITIRPGRIRTSSLGKGGAPSGLRNQAAIGQPVGTQPRLGGASREVSSAEHVSKVEAARRNFATQYVEDAKADIEAWLGQAEEQGHIVHYGKGPKGNPNPLVVEDLLDLASRGELPRPGDAAEVYFDRDAYRRFQQREFQKAYNEFDEQSLQEISEAPSGKEVPEAKMRDLPAEAQEWVKGQDLSRSLSEVAKEARETLPDEVVDEALGVFRREKQAAEHRAGKPITKAEKLRLSAPPRGSIAEGPQKGRSSDLYEWARNGGPMPKDGPAFAGGKHLSVDEFKALQERVKAFHKSKGLPTEEQKWEREWVKEVPPHEQTVAKRIDNMFEWLNLGRPFKTALDVSNPLRQTLMLTADQLTQDTVRAAKKLTRQKVEPASTSLYQNLKHMVQVYGNERLYNELTKEMESRPSWEAAKNDGLRFLSEHNGNENMIGKGKLEKLMSHSKLTRKAFDLLIKSADRAFTYYQNKAMLDAYEYGTEWVRQRYGDKGTTPFTARELVDHLNNASSRGEVTKSKNLNKVLGQLTYSAQMTASRVRMIRNVLTPSPGDFGKLRDSSVPLAEKVGVGFGHYTSPAARAYARAQTVRAMAGVGAMMAVGYYAAKAAGQDPSIETDARSTDYMKLKLNDSTTIDMMGGFQQYIVRASQISHKQKKEITTGRIKEISPIDVLTSFARGKLGPGASAAVDIAQGRKVSGEAIDFNKDTSGAIQQTLSTMFSNMNLSDAMEVWKANPHTAVLLPITGVMLLGASVSAGQGGKSDWLTEDIRAKDKAVTQEMKRFQLSGPRPGHRISLPGYDVTGKRLYYNMTTGEVKKFEQEVMPTITKLLYDFVNSPQYRGLPESKKPARLQAMIHQLNLFYSANQSKQREYGEKFRKGELKPSGYQPEALENEPAEAPEVAPGGRGEKY